MSTLPPFQFVRPPTVGEAVRLLSAEGAVAMAGGTELLGSLRERVASARTVVPLSGLDALRGVTRTTRGLRIGATTTLLELSEHPEIRTRYTALADAARGVGTLQLRAQGTVAGNLCQRPRCWYFRNRFGCLRSGGSSCPAAQGENRYHAIFDAGACMAVSPSDLAPALLAFDAHVRILGPRERARTLPLSALYAGVSENPARETALTRGEVITEILLPPLDASAVSGYRKIRERCSWDFALASVAVALEWDGATVREARVVLGGVSLAPRRAPAAERELVVRRLDSLVVDRASHAATEGAQPLAQNGFKVPLVQGLVHQVLTGISGRGVTIPSRERI